MNNYQALVEMKLEPLAKSGDNYIYRCPKCEGNIGSGHLYINYKKNKYNCFKCDVAGSDIRRLLYLLGVDAQFDYENIFSSYQQSLDDILSAPPKCMRMDYSKNLKLLTAYYDWHTKELSEEAYLYLQKRGVSDSTIYNLRIKEGVNRYGEQFSYFKQEYAGVDYSQRIMVPSLRKDGTISYYVGRDYTGKKKNKYVNPSQKFAYASEDVWNLDMINSKHVIICEGVFSAITAGGIKMNACATYGKSISRSSNTDREDVIVPCQGEKLLAKKFDTYYVAYDSDALREALNTCRYLFDRGANVKLVYIDPQVYGMKADANDIGYDTFLSLLSSAKKYDRLLELELGFK